MKCIRCGGETEKALSSRIYFDKIIINPVKVQKCAKCGEEYLDEKEYEKVRKRAQEIKNKNAILIALTEKEMNDFRKWKANKEDRSAREQLEYLKSKGLL